MRNRLLPIVILIGLPVTAWAQPNLTWKHLADVDFEWRFFKEYNQKFLVPIFGKTPKSYEGKEVHISGYVIPLDVRVYALSKNPYAACFFCGAAGPETIVELQIGPDGAKRYKMDQWMTFKGILRLNDSDVSHFNYILEKAVPVN
ncbi:MAG: DUF3299 domain-containing protein [Haliscomenobacter sp.]|nr:DUF3299 domain-containing protein [Haliscomenobacter sp.]MBK8655465.1 DUF3299 domain-containing protein [Haliscomenobacter sp.]